MRAVTWSAVLLLARQGVWNLAPVIVTSRMVDDPAAAAGFVTAAVILRAPVLLFPSVQAFLLPAFTEMTGTGDDATLRRTVRKLGVAILAGGALWVLIAIFVVPTVAHLIFAATTHAARVGARHARRLDGRRARSPRSARPSSWRSAARPRWPWPGPRGLAALVVLGADRGRPRSWRRDAGPADRGGGRGDRHFPRAAHPRDVRTPS